MKIANFKVDTSLTSILGENYRSTEAAIKELVDNAWDADSAQLKIIMPEPFAKAEIIIEDNGSGMTEKEIRNEYLFIARSRTSRKGEITPLKKRKVKGRKGIGKFAGLLVAGEMQLISKARGKETTVTIVKDEILKWKDDLEKLDLKITTKDCTKDDKGTTIILRQLNQNLNFPNPVRLSQILLTEYGRENGFDILINDKSLDIQDLVGYSENGTSVTKLAGKVNYSFTISEGKKKLKQSGIAIRVKGKIIGKPTYFGLEEEDDIPKILLKKIYAEVEVDGLADDITADWGAIFENSKKLEEVKKLIKPKIKKAIQYAYSQQIHIAKTKIENKISKDLQQLPSHKRDFAKRSLDKVLKSYYNESDEKINTIISVVLDTIEKDEYHEVLSNIKSSSTKKTKDFAIALSQFGTVESSLIGGQTKNRSTFLDFFERLISNNKTTEKEIHQSFENNLWLLDEQFSMMTSNAILNKISNDFLSPKLKSNHKNKKPFLILCQDYKNNILLIRLKAPSHTIDKIDKTQAEQYRKVLKTMFPNSDVSILIIGKDIAPDLKSSSVNNTIILYNYQNLVSSVKNRLSWLAKQSN